MKLETDRLLITDFTPEMAEAVHKNSLDEDNRRFVPDEVFETVDEALETVEFLISRYDGTEGPFVHPILLKTGENIGYIQLVPIEQGWELGYHIAKAYTGKGYATEAARAFLPAVAEKYGLPEIYGICLKDNAASARVMEKCGFCRVFSGVAPYQGVDREIIRNVWTPKPRIRLAKQRDIPRILELLVQVNNVHHDIRPWFFIAGKTKYEEADLQTMLGDGNAPIFVAADENDRVLGYSFAFLREQRGHNLTGGRTLYIDDLCIDAAFRGQGIGRLLLEHTKDFARAQGCRDITLNVWEGNDSALQFYLRQDFRPRSHILELAL